MEFSTSDLTGFNLFSSFSTYFDCHRVYFTYFRKIPSLKILDRVDPARLMDWLTSEKEFKIREKHAKQRYDRLTKELKDVDSFYLLENNILLNVEEDKVRVLYDSSQEEIASQVFRHLISLTKRENQRHEISMVTEGQSGMQTSSVKIKKPLLDLTTHYNEDLLVIHKKVIGSLRKKDKSGLFLFHGEPGTGKSTYIRYLIHSIPKKVLFIPPGIAANLDAISLTKLLLDNANSVFVIEDAEELLSSRDAGKNSTLSMLLNLTDGLLGNALGIQIIITFNTVPANLDKALLRKGRLIALYEFKPLSIFQSQALLEKLGISDYLVTGPMTLADIFHAKDTGFQFQNNQRSRIGFLKNAL